MRHLTSHPFPSLGTVNNDITEISCIFLKLFSSDSYGDQAETVQSLPGVTLVEYNKQTHARERLHAIPTDTLRGQNDAIYAEMNLYNAWEITKGDPRIKIGVLDSGVDMRHPDINCVSGGVFQDGMFTTNGHLPMKIVINDFLAGVTVSFGSNIGLIYIYEHNPDRLSTLDPYAYPGIPEVPVFKDSTCNTIGRDVNGNFWVDRPVDLWIEFDDVAPTSIRGVGLSEMWDGWGHGTAIGGLISSPHNGNGFCGIAPGCTTIMYKIVNNEYVMNSANTIAAVQRAVADGCHVLSLSYGGPYEALTAAEHAIYAWAIAQGVIIVLMRQLGWIPLPRC